MDNQDRSKYYLSVLFIKSSDNSADPFFIMSDLSGCGHVVTSVPFSHVLKKTFNITWELIIHFD